MQNFLAKREVRLKKRTSVKAFGNVDQNHVEALKRSEAVFWREFRNAKDDHARVKRHVANSVRNAETSTTIVSEHHRFDNEKASINRGAEYEQQSRNDNLQRRPS